MIDQMDKICPYPGLRAFTEDESIYFKGRENHIDQLIKLLEANNFLMVTGASGDGKSSLIYAGLIPAIRAGFFKAKYNSWAIATVRPERQPLLNLANALSATLNFENSSTIKTLLSYGYSALVDAYKNSSLFPESNQKESEGNEEKPSKSKPANLLILIDQFEELFTYPENYKNGRLSSQAKVLVNLVNETNKIALEQELPIYIVCTMRSDYIGHCSCFSHLPELIGNSHYFVPRLNRYEIIQIIEEPTLLSGNQINRRLVERLVYDLKDGIDLLPVLQHALYQIWTIADNMGAPEMDLIHYAIAGGMASSELPPEDQEQFNIWLNEQPEFIKGLLVDPCLENILNTHADKLFESAFHELPEKEAEFTKEECQRILKIVFKCLTKIDENKPVRNRMTLQEISEMVGDTRYDYKTVSQIIEIYRQQGNTLLHPFVDPQTPKKPLMPSSVIDITHEALIRNWKRLAKWSEEEFESKETFSELATHLERWLLNKKSEQFLLPVGPFYYFKEWYKKQLPNPAWIRRYMDDDILSTPEFSEQNMDKFVAEKMFQADGANVSPEILKEINYLKLVDKHAISKVAKKGDAEMLFALISKFLDLSGKAIEKGKRFKSLGIILAAVGVLLAIGLIYVGKINSDIKKTAHSNEIATMAYRNLDNDPTLAFRLAEQAYYIEKTPLARQVLMASYARFPFYQVLEGHKASVNIAKYSHNGEMIATGDGDGAIYLWTKNGQLIKKLDGHKDAMYISGNESINFSHSDKFLVSASVDCTAIVWNLEDFSKTILVGHSGKVHSAVFSNDDKLIMTASADSTVRLWELSSKEILKIKSSNYFRKSVFMGKDNDIFPVPFRLESKLLIYNINGSIKSSFEIDSPNIRDFKISETKDRIVAVTDSLLYIFNMNGKLLHIGAGDFPTGTGSSELALNDSLEYIAVKTNENNVDIYNYEGLKINTLRGHASHIWALHFSIDNQFLVSAGDDGFALIWNPQGQLLYKMLGHKGQILSADFSPDNRFVVTTSFDNTARIWDMKPKYLTYLNGQTASIYNLTTFDKLNQFATFAYDYQAIIWNFNGLRIKTLAHDYYAVTDCKILSDNKGYLSSNGNSGLYIWEIDGIKKKEFLKGKKRYSHYIELNSKRDLILTFDKINSVILVDTEENILFESNKYSSGLFVPGSNDFVALAMDNYISYFEVSRDGKKYKVTELKKFLGHKNKITKIVFSEDGKKLISGSVDHTAKVWSINGDLLISLEGHKDIVDHCLFGINQNSYITSSFDKTIRIWNIHGKCNKIIKGHTATIFDIDISPDKSKILTACEDNLIRLFDMEGNLLEVYAGHTKSVNFAKFTPDGKSVVSGSDDHVVLILPLYPEDVLHSMNVDKVRGPVWNISEEDKKVYGIYR